MNWRMYRWYVTLQPARLSIESSCGRAVVTSIRLESAFGRARSRAATSGRGVIDPRGGAFLLLLYELLIRYGQKSQPKSYSSYKTRLLCRQVGVASLHFDH